MNAAAYLVDIANATDSGTLIQYLSDAVNDANLIGDEKRTIRTAIADRFEELAVHHVENNFPKGRWTSTASVPASRHSGLDQFALNPS